MGILWIIIVGFIAGLIARFLAPGPNKPLGFLFTTALGIAGAFVATLGGIGAFAEMSSTAEIR